MAVVVEVRELVGPLCDNAQGIFEESNDDEEAADAREVSTGRISRSRKRAASWHRFRCTESRTHGLMGSKTVSSRSSSLLVWARSWSSGLGSFVLLSLRPELPKGLWLPKW